jgi:copper(I)-binding protein
MRTKNFDPRFIVSKFFFLVTLFSIFASPVSASEPCLTIQNAWIAEAPPVSKVMVAYLTIINNTPEEIEIIRAESELYSSIEFHETKHENAMARMIRHQSLSIPENDKLILQRGGNHLMLFNPTKALKANDEVKITFTLSDGSTQSINVPVKKPKF